MNERAASTVADGPAVAAAGRAEAAGFDGVELLRLGAHLKRAFIVENRQQQHRHGEESEYAKSDADDQALH